MTAHKTACIILAAGKGTRMKSALPKPLHPIAGRSMINHVIATAEELAPEKIVVVVSPGMPGMEAAVKPHAIAVQAEANGTAGAALAAREHLDGFDGDVLIIYGDSPLVTAGSLRRAVEARRQIPSAGLVFAGMRPADPGMYGRMVVGEDGTLEKIVEFRDATAEERRIPLCNGAIVCADGRRLFEWLSKISSDNAQGEYIITDLPKIARADNRIALVVEVDALEMEGANTRVELARLEKTMQDRLREKHMLAGATLQDPATVYFSYDTVLGQDVTVGPGVVFGPGVTVEDNAEIRAYSYLEGAAVASGAVIGPFARLREGSDIGAGARVGNFVETKKTRLGAGAKVNHLSYVGDAEVGEKANIGAGVITCNYDGFMKHRTTIGREAFIGSNTALIAPVDIGAGAVVGAGSAIRGGVPENALALARAPQVHKDGWAAEFRRDRMKQKAKDS